MQWQLALTHVVAAWLKADKTKTGQGVFRKDKLKKAGWVVAMEAMNKESDPEGSYAHMAIWLWLMSWSSDNCQKKQAHSATPPPRDAPPNPAS